MHSSPFTAPEAGSLTETEIHDVISFVERFNILLRHSSHPSFNASHLAGLKGPQAGPRGKKEKARKIILIHREGKAINKDGHRQEFLF